MPDVFWRCAACDESNPPYTEVCRTCYRPPTAEELDRLATATQREQVKWNSCPICGLAVGATDSESVICAGCDGKLKKAAERWHVAEPPTRFKTLWTVLVSAVVMFWVGGVLGFLESDSPLVRVFAALLGVVSVLAVGEGLAMRCIRVRGAIVTWRRNPFWFSVVAAFYTFLGAGCLYFAIRGPVL